MKAFCTLISLTALAFPTYGVDGVVLINQSNALAGNVTPGDAPGFPVTITAPGSYRLSSNLTVPDANTTGIEVDADGVTIDLNGFSIIGPTVCSGTPVTSCTPTGSGAGILSFQSRISIYNGIIRGMGGSGVELASSARIERVQAIGNGGNGISTNGAVQFVGAFVSSSVASGNGSSGILANEVIRSYANGNGRDGIGFLGVARDNNALSNGGAGIRGPGSMSGNSTARNSSGGIAVTCPSILINNSATLNTGGNIVQTGSGCSLANNTAP
jgi:hypothetical protein